jgi:hypothetical protein
MEEEGEEVIPVGPESSRERSFNKEKGRRRR